MIARSGRLPCLVSSPRTGHRAGTVHVVEPLHQTMPTVVLSWVNRLRHYALVPCPEDVTIEYLDTHHQGNVVRKDGA
jgi:hypothetical protein